VFPSFRAGYRLGTTGLARVPGERHQERQLPATPLADEVTVRAMGEALAAALGLGGDRFWPEGEFTFCLWAKETRFPDADRSWMAQIAGLQVLKKLSTSFPKAMCRCSGADHLAR
jgi:hypothetical protein